MLGIKFSDKMLYVDPTYDTIDLEQWAVIQLPK